MADIYKDIYITCGFGIAPSRIYRQSSVITMTENDTARLIVTFPVSFATYAKSVDIKYNTSPDTEVVESFDLTYSDTLLAYTFILRRTFTYYEKVYLQFRATDPATEQVFVDPTIMLLVFRPALKSTDLEQIDDYPTDEQTVILQGMTDQHAELVGSTLQQGHFKVDGTSVIASDEGVLTFIGASGYSGWSGYSGATGPAGDLAVNMIIDGGGSVITAGTKGYVVIPFSGTVGSWTILGDQSGSIVVDVKRSTYSGFPTTSSIAGTEKPTLSAVQKNQDLSLGSWTTSLSAGDILEFVVEATPATVTRVTVELTITR